MDCFGLHSAAHFVKGTFWKHTITVWYLHSQSINKYINQSVCQWSRKYELQPLPLFSIFLSLVSLANYIYISNCYCYRQGEHEKYSDGPAIKAFFKDTDEILAFVWLAMPVTSYRHHRQTSVMTLGFCLENTATVRALNHFKNKPNDGFVCAQH